MGYPAQDMASKLHAPLRELREAEREQFAVARLRHADWRQMLPAHRLPVLAKTPLLVALGLYLAGGRLAAPHVGATMLLATLLWTILYILNEATDLALEQHCRVGRGRFAALLAGAAMVCLLAGRLEPRLGLLFALMTLGQLAYCLPFPRLKRWWWAVLVLSGVANPILRLLCGAVWGAHGIGWPVYGVFVCLHLGASMRSRGLLRDRDKNLAYHVAPAGLEIAGMLSTGVGFAGAFGLCAGDLLPRLSLPFLLIALAFSAYAWSGRVTSVARLRRGWIGFAVLAIVALAILFRAG